MKRVKERTSVFYDFAVHSPLNSNIFVTSFPLIIAAFKIVVNLRPSCFAEVWILFL